MMTMCPYCKENVHQIFNCSVYNGEPVTFMTRLLSVTCFITVLFMAELLHGEKEHSSLFFERSKFCCTEGNDGPLTESQVSNYAVTLMVTNKRTETTLRGIICIFVSFIPLSINSVLRSFNFVS